MEMKELLGLLAAAPSAPGTEQDCAETIKSLLEGTADVFETDALGNLWARRGTKGPGVLLLAHMDKIGYIVTGVDEATGFLRIDRCGGSDPRVAPALRVKVFGKQTLPGVIVSTPPHLAGPDAAKKAKPIDELTVDCGLPYETVKDLVFPGDRILVDAPLEALLGTRVTSPYLDDAAGVAAAIRCAQLLKEAGSQAKLDCVFTTREEVGGQGGDTAAFASDAKYAVAIDVSFAKAPGTPESVTATLGSGTMIGFAPVLDKELSRRFVSLAEKHGVPYTVEVMGRYTGTDADGALTAGEGKVTGLLSIPERSMHTPVEIVDTLDVEATAKLLAAFVRETEEEA